MRKLVASVSVCFVPYLVSACGVSDSDVQVSGGMVHGSDSLRANDPMGYTVGIDTSSYRCSGTLIHKQVVLTAAHCQISAGDIVFNRANSTISAAKVTRVVSHQLFNKYLGSESASMDSAAVDYAILLLDREMLGRPLALASVPPPVGAVVVGSGFGTNDTNGMDRLLRSATMTAREIKFSSENPGYAAIGSIRGSGSTCGGDSGGPLVYAGRLVGVLHGGGGRTDLCRDSLTNMHASVASQLSWINLNMNALLATKPVASAPVYSPNPTPVYSPNPTPVYSPNPTPVYSPSPTPVYAPAPTPVYAPAPTPVYAPAPIPSQVGASCNQGQLDICLSYGGGDACYTKWGCVKPEPLF